LLSSGGLGLLGLGLLARRLLATRRLRLPLLPRLLLSLAVLRGGWLC